MKVQMRACERRLRWSSIILGGMLLFWLPTEDQNFTMAILFAIASCLLGVLIFSSKRNLSPKKYIGLCFWAGISIGPISFLLLVFKIGLHKHSTPDFSLSQLLQLIKITPVWGIVGALLGGGIYLLHLSRSY